MVSRIVAVSFPQLWDNADASVLLPAIGVCRIDSPVKPVVEDLEERSMTSSSAGKENSIRITVGLLRQRGLFGEHRR